MNATLERIKYLTALRERVVETKEKLEVPIGVVKAVGDHAMAKF